MHILVTGSKGQLGSEIKELSSQYPQYNFYFTDIEELNICKKEEIDTYFNDHEIDVLINCAAYTAVDQCETEKKKARELNVLAVKNLALACSAKNVSIVHISTDYVYDGKNHIPYKETDFTNPESYYGQTKLEGENMLEEFANTAIIIRTSWLYSSFGKNFVKTMLKYGQERDELKVVFDQIGTPTYAADLAEIILKNIHQIDFFNGVHYFHYSNEGVCSWYDFAKEILDIKQINCIVIPIITEEYPLPAPRPAYSVLNKSKIKNELSIQIPHWKDSLAKCLQKL